MESRQSTMTSQPSKKNDVSSPNEPVWTLTSTSGLTSPIHSPISSALGLGGSPERTCLE